jgi:hypothetical protein
LRNLSGGRRIPSLRLRLAGAGGSILALRLRHAGAGGANLSPRGLIVGSSRAGPGGA